MLSTNLKYLRNKAGLSQQAAADALQIPRTTLGDYERGNTEPNLEMLECISKLFDVTIDALVKEDLRHRDYEIIRNKDFRVLAISVDKDDNENIELVDSKAEAGYLDSLHDPEYIRDLPKIYFPSIPHGTYRGFEITGDSMLPLEPGSIVICSFLENPENMKEGRTYVVVTPGGIVYKRFRQGAEQHTLTLESDNEVYAPYSVHLSEVKEVWQYYAHLSFSDAKVSTQNAIENRLLSIQNDVKAIKEKLKH